MKPIAVPVMSSHQAGDGSFRIRVTIRRVDYLSTTAAARLLKVSRNALRAAKDGKFGQLLRWRYAFRDGGKILWERESLLAWAKARKFGARAPRSSSKTATDANSRRTNAFGTLRGSLGRPSRRGSPGGRGLADPTQPTSKCTRELTYASQRAGGASRQRRRTSEQRKGVRR